MDSKEKWRSHSESYYSAMQKRLNLQSISSFIREEGVKVKISKDSFERREKTAFSNLETWLTQTYGEAQAETIIDYMLNYTCVIQEIYFNLGMKAGATLLCKLTDTFETDI